MNTHLYHPIPNDYIHYHNITENNNANSSLPYHRHDAYEIYLFLNGNANMYLEHSCYSLCKGDLLIINPNELHRSVVLDSSPYERIGINVKRSLLEKLSSRQTWLLHCFEQRPLGENNLIHLSTEQLKQYVSLSSQLNDAHNYRGFGQELLIETYLTQILILVNNIYRQANSSFENIMPPLVKDTILYIRDHLTEEIHLSELAKVLNYNGTYISYKFKEHTGLTLRSFILDQRIARAKYLLKEGLSVSEACDGSGFKDYSNFIRSFTKITGVSPGKYRYSC